MDLKKAKVITENQIEEVTVGQPCDCACENGESKTLSADWDCDCACSDAE